MTDALALSILDIQAEKAHRQQTLAAARVARIARRLTKTVRRLHDHKEHAEARARLQARKRLHRKKAA